MRNVCWYWSLWVSSLECRAESTGNRKQEGWFPSSTEPTWTSAHVVMPQMMGQAYICFHEGKFKTTAVLEINAGANTHPAYRHTFCLCCYIYFFLFILHTWDTSQCLGLTARMQAGRKYHNPSCAKGDHPAAQWDCMVNEDSGLWNCWLSRCYSLWESFTAV